MPEITVGITSYNLGKYISTCISELFVQTYQSFELVIYDDCSTDQTRLILSGFQVKYPDKIKLIFGEEALRNPAKARNAILDSGLVQGRYIVFLDGDDSLERTFLEELYTAAQKNQADIALCAYDRVEEDTGHILCQEMRGFPEVIQFPTEEDILAFINGSLWNKLILVESIGSVRLPDFTVGEDLSFLLALYNRCRRITCVDKLLIHYRVRAASVISNTQEETAYQFAQELTRLKRETAGTWFQDTIELVAFIHIGISMPLRVYRGPSTDMSHLLRWISTYFRDEFDWFRGQRLLRLPALLRHGMKGIGLWGAKIFYRIRCFRLFLYLYQAITKVLHIDIKF